MTTSSIFGIASGMGFLRRLVSISSHVPSIFMVLFNVRIGFVLATQTSIGSLLDVGSALSTDFDDVTSARCAFPEDWRGSWYESRDGDVTITSTRFSNKGTCVETDHRFYYLIENSEIGCLTCLSVRLRHFNILQYQENAGRPSLCPFRDAYHFAYSNNSGGFCRNPMSYVKPCAPSGQLRFHFRHCSDAAYTYDADVDVECLAAWQDEQSNFLIGRLVSRDKTSKHGRYRCIVHASCRGLLSPRNGPIVMEFTQDVFGWPKSQCLYPSWVVRTAWRDLNGQHVYRSFYDDSPDGAAAAAIIHVGFRPSADDSRLETMKVLRCFSVVDRNTTVSQLTTISFVTYGCLTKYQCIKFVKHKGVIEIHEGRYTDHPYEPCWETEMLESNRRILIPDAVTSRTCPLRGQYIIQTGSATCTSYLRVGCNRTDVIEFGSSCAAKREIKLECLKSWKYDKTRYVVARLADDQGGRGVANCFSIQRREWTMQFAVDFSCNAGTMPLLPNFGTISYVVDRQTFECSSTMPSTYVHLQQLHRQRQQQSSSSSSALSNARFPTSRRRGGGRGRGTYRVLRPDGDNEDDGRPARTRGYVRHRMYQVSVGSSATTLSSAAGNKTWLTVAIQAFATYAAVRSSL